MHGRVSLSPKADIRPVKTAGDEINLGQILNFIARRWKLIVGAAFGFAALAFIGSLALTPRYTATAEVLLEPKKENIFGGDSIIPALNLDTGNVDSQVSVIQSIGLLRRVVEKNNLADDTEFGHGSQKSLLSTLKEMVFPAQSPPSPAASADDDIPEGILRTIDNLSSALNVARVGRTYVISISLTSKDPAKAVHLANAVADAYVVDRLDARYDAAKRASAWLTDRIASLRDQVREAEEAVAKFRQDNNLTVSSEGTVAVGEQQLSELNAKLVAARTDTAEKRAKYDQARQVKDRGGDLQAIPDVVRSLVISDLRKQEAEVTRKEADLVARYSEAHPAVVNARAERRDIERSISAEVSRIIANLKNDFDVAKARENSLQTSLNALTGQGGGDGTLGVKLRELERVAAANRTLFENFLSRAKITQEQVAFEEREARVISPATKPKAPSFPKKPMIIGAAFVLGLALGLGGAFALDLLNSGFTTPKELETLLGRPVLSSVSLLTDAERKVEGKILDPVNYLLKKPLSRYAEQVRSVRVGVQMADVDDPAKVLLITSSVPKEGKSTLSACLAFSAAKAGQKTLLLDGDLRHPATTKYFGLDARPGLVDYLTGAVTFESILVPAGPIIVLPAGSISQNPADLLASARMKHMVEQLRMSFDYIVIDSPPVAPVIDAKVMQHLVDKVIYVARWQSTSREMVVDCLKQLGAERRLAGVVLNLVNDKKASRYGASPYYSSPQYNGYYQS